MEGTEFFTNFSLARLVIWFDLITMYSKSGFKKWIIFFPEEINWLILSFYLLQALFIDGQKMVLMYMTKFVFFLNSVDKFKNDPYIEFNHPHNYYLEAFIHEFINRPCLLISAANLPFCQVVPCIMFYQIIWCWYARNCFNPIC